MAVELTADFGRLKAEAEGRQAFKSRPVYEALAALTKQVRDEAGRATRRPRDQVGGAAGQSRESPVGSPAHLMTEANFRRNLSLGGYGTSTRWPESVKMKVALPVSPVRSAFTITLPSP